MLMHWTLDWVGGLGSLALGGALRCVLGQDTSLS